MHGILNTYISIGMKLYHDTQLRFMSHSWWCLSQVESIERGPDISVIKKNKWHWVSWRRTIFRADDILAHVCVCVWQLYNQMSCAHHRQHSQHHLWEARQQGVGGMLLSLPVLLCFRSFHYIIKAWLAFIERKWNYFGPSLSRKSVSCIVISFISLYSHILAFSSPLGLQKAL